MYITKTEYEPCVTTECGKKLNEEQRKEKYILFCAMCICVCVYVYHGARAEAGWATELAAMLTTPRLCVCSD